MSIENQLEKMALELRDLRTHHIAETTQARADAAEAADDVDLLLDAVGRTAYDLGVKFEHNVGGAVNALIEIANEFERKAKVPQP
jgi:hypothetical protein